MNPGSDLSGMPKISGGGGGSGGSDRGAVAFANGYSGAAPIVLSVDETAAALAEAMQELQRARVAVAVTAAKVAAADAIADAGDAKLARLISAAGGWTGGVDGRASESSRAEHPFGLPSPWRVGPDGCHRSQGGHCGPLKVGAMGLGEGRMTLLDDVGNLT